MYRLIYSTLVLALFALMGCDSDPSTPTPGNAIDEQVANLLEEMSIEEKVGQMTQINIDVIMVGEIYNLEEPQRIDSLKLAEAIKKYKVGSVLNVGGHAYSRAQWREIISTIQRVAVRDGDHGIPILYGIDAIHGANYTLGSTLFPQQLAQAATWNPGLVRAGAKVTAYEVRASGIPWNFSPVLDLGRQPLWSRFFETYGEDVLLAKRMGVACVEGYQEDLRQGGVAACMKHFVGYSVPFSGKDRTPVYLGERQLREYYLPTFQAAIDAGAKTLMVNSGEINGIPVHANPYLLKTVLRDELGFEGVVVTDWEDIMKLYNIHHVAEDNREAVKMAINAGIDMSMVPNDYAFTEDLIDLVKSGEVSIERIDEAVGRILKLKFELGLMDDAQPPALDDYPEFGGPVHHKAAYETAVESITLLSNKDVLPLSPSSKVLVTGPAANDLAIQNGAWSRTWQGLDTFITKEEHPTIFEALKNRMPAAEYVLGSTLDSIADIDRARKSAASADVIVLCLGERPSTEKVGDIHDLTMSPSQLALAEAMLATGKPVVLVLVENRPQIISTIAERCDAVVLAYQPGNAGGEALADLLIGERNFSGKLPFTYPRYVNEFITYDHKATEELDPQFGMTAFRPQWEFGHGLGYTSFTYSDLEVDASKLGDGVLTVGVTVKNDGSRDGKEVVMVFVKDETASITPSVKRLRAFEKVLLEAGESKRMRFDIPVQDLAFVGLDPTKWVVEKGTFEVQVAGLATTFELK